MYSFRLCAVISDTLVTLGFSIETTKRRFWVIAWHRFCGSFLYIPLAKTMIIGHCPCKRNFNTSFSIGDWKPLTTAMSFCLLISIAQSSVGMTSVVAIRREAMKPVFLSFSSSLLPKYSALVIRFLHCSVHHPFYTLCRN